MLRHTKWLAFHFPATSAVLSEALCALSSSELRVLRKHRESVESRALFVAPNLLSYDFDQVTEN